MNWSEEQWVKLYTRDSRNWRLMGWQARCLLVMLMRKVNRRGELELEPGWTEEVLAEELDLPIEVVSPGLKRLVDLGSVTRCHQPAQPVTEGHQVSVGVTLANFIEAQRTRQTDAVRQRASRDRRRAETEIGHQPSPMSPAVTSETGGDNVTSRHQPSPMSPGVTIDLRDLRDLRDQREEIEKKERACARAESGPKDQGGGRSRSGPQPVAAVLGALGSTPPVGNANPDAADMRATAQAWKPRIAGSTNPPTPVCVECKTPSTSVVSSQRGPVCTDCYFQPAEEAT